MTVPVDIGTAAGTAGAVVCDFGLLVFLPTVIEGRIGTFKNIYRYLVDFAILESRPWST